MGQSPGDRALARTDATGESDPAARDQVWPRTDRGPPATPVADGPSWALPGQPLPPASFSRRAASASSVARVPAGSSAARAGAGEADVEEEDDDGEVLVAPPAGAGLRAASATAQGSQAWQVPASDFFTGPQRARELFAGADRCHCRRHRSDPRRQLRHGDGCQEPPDLRRADDRHVCGGISLERTRVLGISPPARARGS